MYTVACGSGSKWRDRRLYQQGGIARQRVGMAVGTFLRAGPVNAAKVLLLRSAGQGLHPDVEKRTTDTCELVTEDDASVSSGTDVASWLADDAVDCITDQELVRRTAHRHRFRIWGGACGPS